MTILWDNDGVLVDTERLFFQSSREALAQVGVEYTRDHFIEISLNKGKSAFALAEKRGVPPLEIDRIRDWRNQRYGELLQETNCVLDGVEEVLTQLHGKVGMGVVTSSRRDHFEIIHANSGILKYFDFVLTLEDYPRSKPHPDPYLTAMERNGLTADECVVVEDSERGLAAALAAGLRCLVLPNELTRECPFEGAYKVLNSIHEVPEEVLRILTPGE